MIFERVVFRRPEKTFEKRADTRMGDGNGEEGFAEQHVFEAGNEGEADIEAEKSSKHGVKQPLILLWNRYQASILANNQNFSKLLFIKACHTDDTFLQDTDDHNF